MEKSWKNIIMISVSVLGIALLIIGLLCYFIIMDISTVYTNINEYEKVLGKNGRYKETYFGTNDIFPDTIPSSAEVEEFHFEHYSFIDDSYVGYLVYTCNEEEFEKEKARLKNIKSDDNHYVYGATGFSYEVCAIYADEYYGYIYALADEENSRFIYVDIQFCNYFADINYDNIIDKKYLPENFDAKRGNKTRLEFEKDFKENEFKSILE